MENKPKSMKKNEDFVDRITNKDLKPKKKPTEKQMFVTRRAELAREESSKPKSKKRIYNY